MKTAMQELWEILNDAEKEGVYEIGTQNFKRYIEGIYLEKEKQSIIDSYNDGRQHGFNKYENAEDYYFQEYEKK